MGTDMTWQTRHKTWPPKTPTFDGFSDVPILGEALHIMLHEGNTNACSCSAGLHAVQRQHHLIYRPPESVPWCSPPSLMMPPGQDMAHRCRLLGRGGPKQQAEGFLQPAHAKWCLRMHRYMQWLSSH